MKTMALLVALSAVGLLSACGTDSFLGKAEESCVKYATVEAR
jgi:uncharacterized lipoprotein